MVQKQLYLIILIAMWITPSFAYFDPSIVDRMQAFEKDMKNCFMNANVDFLQLKDDNTGGDDKAKKVPYLDYETFKKSYKTFAEIFEFLEKTLKGTSNNTSPLYENVVKLYVVGINDKNLAYHNICHGIFVAKITWEFFKYYTSIKPSKLTDLEVAAYVFAGLGHDFGHPGLGNNIYNIDETRYKSLQDTITKNFEAYFDKKTFDSFVSFMEKEEPFKASFDKFNLETLHAKLATFLFRQYVGVSEDNLKLEATIEKSIGFTLMSADASTCDNLLDYVVHAADVALGGVYDTELMYEGVRTVYEEFYREGQAYMSLIDKATHSEFAKQLYMYTNNNRFMDKKKPWMNLVDLIKGDFANIFSGQVGFNNFVVLPTFKALEVFNSDIFVYFTTNISNNNLLWNIASANIKNLAIDTLPKNSDTKMRMNTLMGKYKPNQAIGLNHQYNSPLTFSEEDFKNLFKADSFKEEVTKAAAVDMEKLKELDEAAAQKKALEQAKDVESIENMLKALKTRLDMAKNYRLIL